MKGNDTQIKRTSRKALEHFLNLRYPITVYPEPNGGYVAMIKALPGCITQGETPDEIMANIEEARQLWIETVYEHSGSKRCMNTVMRFHYRLMIYTPMSEIKVQPQCCICGCELVEKDARLHAPANPAVGLEQLASCLVRSR